MKRPILSVASLLSVCLLSACSQHQAGKADFAAACVKQLGGSHEKCACYTDQIQSSLKPETFQQMADAAYDNREYASADLVPNRLRSDPDVRGAMGRAMEACFG